jgi:crotonobetainyl-CoA:carnitine CoA-transferase CaiB-like acyl-CoA transferase
VVISCRTEAQWEALVGVMGRPAWTNDRRFASLRDRVENADALDGLVETWTSTRDRYEIMETLQAVGVPAGVVQDAADRLERDPQLAARGHFTSLGNAEVGPLPLEGVPFRMSATPPHTGGLLHRGPPLLGQDTATVLSDLLGMTADEIEALSAEGVLS